MSPVCPSCGERTPGASERCPACGAPTYPAGVGRAPLLPADLASKNEYAGHFVIDIRFARGTSRAYVQAVKLAETHAGYSELKEGEFAHRVSYSMSEALAALDQLNLVSRLPHRIVYQGTEVVTFDDLRPSLMCLIKRYEAEDPEDYCSGYGAEGSVYLCHQSGLRRRRFPDWIYDYIVQEAPRKFRLDLPNFRHMVTGHLERYRFCPFARGEFVEAALEKLANEVARSESVFVKYLDPIAHRDDPERRRVNRGDKPLYQRICTLHGTCGRCAPFHGFVHDGMETVVPLAPVHPDCSCVDREIAPGEASKGFPTLYEIYPQLSVEERAAILGSEVRELVDAGAVNLIDVFKTHRVRDLWELARDMNFFALSKLGLSHDLLEKLRVLKSKAALLEREQLQWSQEVKGSARKGFPLEISEREAAYKLLRMEKKKGTASPIEVYKVGQRAPARQSFLDRIKRGFRFRQG